MGDLVRGAFQASGIDEEMERLIAEVILQKWSNDKRLFASDHNEDNQNPNDPCCSKDLTISAENPVYRGELSSSASQQPVGQSTTPGLDCAKVRLLSEQLWRRLERKYELKLQAWKKSEEKQLEEMLEKLRAEYKQSIDAKHTQYTELASRKEDELRKLETRLKEDFRLEQEKYQLKLQQEWRLIEAEKRDLRAQKDQLETAKSNFSIKMQHEEMCLKRDQTALARMNETLLERKRKLDEVMREKTISKAGQIQENWLNEMVNEWNEKEAKLSQKCSKLAERVQQMSELPNKIRQQDEIIQRLKEELNTCREQLSSAQRESNELTIRLSRFADYDTLKDENLKMKFELESGVMAERLKAKEEQAINMGNRLKLVEEASSLRVRELKLQLKLVAEKLERKTAECRKLRSELSLNKSNSQLVSRESTQQHRSHVIKSPSESQSPTSATSTSSFDRNLRNRLRNIDHLSQQLDLSLDKYRRVSLTDHPNNHRRFFTFQNSNANRTLPNYQTRSSHQNQTTHSLRRSQQQQHQLPTQTGSTTPKIRKVLPKNDEFNAEHTFVCPELQEVENCRGTGPSAVGNQRGKVMERRALQANALKASSNSVLLESSSNASVQPLMTSTPMQSFLEVEENGENVEHGSVLSPIKLPLTRKVLSNGDGVNNNNNENRVTTAPFNDLLLKRSQQQRNVAENILKVTSGQDDVKMKDVAETNAKAGTSAENHSDEIDPVMQQYMNIVLKKREEEKKTKEQREDTDEQPSKKNSPESQEASQKSAGSSVIAAKLDHDSAHTESDFDW